MTLLTTDMMARTEHPVYTEQHSELNRAWTLVYTEQHSELNRAWTLIYTEQHSELNRACSTSQ